ncbi:MAG: hypothetical protein IPI35_34350 [Deltaproteobacteria bacterium]|nr:hypothetical protein [Deltaproteobacteria bacterium]
MIGAPLPICACGSCPWRRRCGVRAPGGLGGGVLIATPELGVETLAVTARLLGWPFALLRLGGAPARGARGA